MINRKGDFDDVGDTAAEDIRRILEESFRTVDRGNRIDRAVDGNRPRKTGSRLYVASQDERAQELSSLSSGSGRGHNSDVWFRLTRDTSAPGDGVRGSLLAVSP